MGKYFGTDGFRGKAGRDLTVEHAFRIGRFAGWYYGRAHRARIVIGKDTRCSSYMFESRPVRRIDSFRRGRIPASCNDDAERQLYRQSRRF